MSDRGFDKNNTVRQHYIPQVYLRGFSPEYESACLGKISNSKCCIYFYDIEKHFQSTAVPIDSVCFENSLYEVTGVSGRRVFPNYIERFFGRCESEFSRYRKKLEKKAFDILNYRTKTFLCREEKVFWCTYIVIQILRMPQVIGLAESTCKEMYGVNDNQARNISRIWCTPFFRDLGEDTPEAKLFSCFFEPMADMAFGVFVDEEGMLITSDKTVYIHATSFPCSEYEKIIFPISSKLCLILFGGEEKKKLPKKNFLCPIDNESRRMIFSAIADASFNKVFSNHRLDDEELHLIEQIR